MASYIVMTYRLDWEPVSQMRKPRLRDFPEVYPGWITGLDFSYTSCETPDPHMPVAFWNTQ